MPVISGRKVGSVGYGLSALTTGAHAPTDEVAVAALRAAAESGATLWDGGECYGTPERNSLTVIGKYFDKYPEDADKITLNIKGATKLGFTPDCQPESIRSSVQNCLEHLHGHIKIHMFECARLDRSVPLKDQLDTLQKLVNEGKIETVALSEVNAATIREAVKHVKVAAVEVEMSLFSRHTLTNGVLATCKELDIPVIAYSPIGRGLLTDQFKSFDDIPEKDFRRMLPRFQPGNIETNMKIVSEVQNLAAKRGCTVAQVALGWIVTLGERQDMPTIIPIPGSTNPRRIRENSKVELLSDSEMVQIDTIMAGCEVKGDRYHTLGMSFTNM